MTSPLQGQSVSAKGGASIVPAKDRIEWPYMALLVAIVVMVAAALHLLSAWVTSRLAVGRLPARL
jgi:hypothetical protein